MITAAILVLTLAVVALQFSFRYGQCDFGGDTAGTGEG